MNVAFHTLGCKVNQYETEALKQQFHTAGHQIVDFDTKADAYIINTCTVTNMADKKSRQMMQKAKRMHDKAIVVAVGCFAQNQDQAAFEALGIDLMIGNKDKERVLELVTAFSQDAKPQYVVSAVNDLTEYDSLWLTDTSENTRAHLKIQDGCNQFCSYCIIPYVRGRVRSRKFIEVLEEVGQLAQAGFKEVVLTGIHLTSYEDEGRDLLAVVQAIDSISGIERIRLGSLEPTYLTESVIQALSQIKALCPHFHLSLQSGCDATLKAMNRRYTTEFFETVVNNLRKTYDRPAITTDVIVGFPGETTSHFDTTKTFVARIGFSDLHVFAYALREGTVAAKMKDQIQNSIKQTRSQALIQEGGLSKRDYGISFVGETVTVLFENTVEIEGVLYATGYTPNYLKVFVPIQTETLEVIHTIQPIKITSYTENHVFGDFLLTT